MTSAAVTGEMRKSSISPLERSRTSDSETSDTARCCRIRARTAGPKNDVTVGARGARFTSRDSVGAAITSAGIAAASALPAWIA
jgi:hypothetical protein